MSVEMTYFRRDFTGFSKNSALSCLQNKYSLNVHQEYTASQAPNESTIFRTTQKQTNSEQSIDLPGNVKERSFLKLLKYKLSDIIWNIFNICF